MTLYLKYRPQKISELDLESVRTTLERIIKSEKIPHAFLFAGPKGTGKTSAARILAKVINCENPDKNGEPCNKCEQCLSITKGGNLDVIEIDAASNRGIDDVRSIKENIILAPVSAKKKIYIIDEAHMLTTEASNAFLKTLEEPPAHVVFILATTNPEKLPETVKSRLTFVPFQKATLAEITDKLDRVIVGEKLKTKGNIAQSLAQMSEGSFRDAIKNLEQISLQMEVIDEEGLTQFIKRNKGVDTTNFINIIAGKNSNEAITQIEKLAIEGVSIKNFIDSSIITLHASVLAKNGIGQDNLPNISRNDVLSLIKLFYDAKRDLGITPIEQLPLEIAITKYCDVDEQKPQVLSAVEGKKVAESPKKKEEVAQPEIKIEEEKLIHKNLDVGEKIEGDVWRKILENVRTKDATIEGLLRAAKPVGFDGQVLTIGVYFRFHKERLEILQNRRTLEEILCKTFSKPVVKISYILTERETPLPPRHERLTVATDPDIMEAAKEIFGQ